RLRPGRSRVPLRSFFFSSRRRHPRSKRDWSSDVCSSDLRPPAHGASLHLVSTCAPRPLAGGPRYPSWDVPGETADAAERGVRMSSAGMGGNGPRPPGGGGFGPKTFGGPAAGGGRDPYGGHPVGAPTGHFGGPSGPRGPSGPSGPTGPTGPNSHGSGPKRTWALALVALGCIGAMVLVVGGGITF